MTAREATASVELLWIPLGAGQRVVRLSGGAYESIAAFVQRRPACDLYHSALVVTVPDARYVIEMTPVTDSRGHSRGVVAEGVVGSRLLAKFRVFRYEIRRWRNGVIPDADFASATTTLQIGLEDAQRLLDLVPAVPTPVWGRNELSAGEMWNSNSVTSWVLHRSGVDTTNLSPPAGGRAPGWNAGLLVAARRVTAEGEGSM